MDRVTMRMLERSKRIENNGDHSALEARECWPRHEAPAPVDLRLRVKGCAVPRAEGELLRVGSPTGRSAQGSSNLLLQVPDHDRPALTGGGEQSSVVQALLRGR
jgi:hypothetical protein